MSTSNDEEFNKVIERKARELMRAVGNGVMELDDRGFDGFIRG